MRQRAPETRLRAENSQPSRLERWCRFGVGLMLLSLTAGFFMSGATPPGMCGEVLRHNQLYNIDASGMFYTEVEKMPQLEEGVRKLRAEAERQCQ